MPLSRVFIQIVFVAVMTLAWEWSGEVTPGYIWRAKGGPYDKYEHIGKVEDLNSRTWTDDSNLIKGTVYCYSVCAGTGGTFCSKIACGVAK